MKKVVLSIFIIFLFYGSFSQPIINRAGSANTTQDGRGMWLYNAFMPRYLDTVAANLQKGIDTAGAIIYTYNVNSIWYRQNSPKKWVLLSNGNAPVYTADRGVKILSNNTIRLTDTVEGAGTKFQYLYDKGGAFRVGLAVGTEWDIANIGYGSFAANAGTTASASYSTAFGQATQASGVGAFSAGVSTISSNTGAASFGNSNTASGQNSFAIGLSNIASGSISTSIGNLTKAVGNGSFSTGVGTYMNTLNGVVFGAYNDTTGYYANNTSTQIATDPIFAIGNGSGVGVRANAFEMLRNGATKFSSGITATTDTTTFKPVVMDASGNLRKVSAWNIGGWRLNGNAGTVDGTNFIGTTDNIAFNIRVNNQKAGRVDGLLNTSYGYLALNDYNGGAGSVDNTAIGAQALQSISGGDDNTGVGVGSLLSTTSGIGNTGIGINSGITNITGSNNTNIGAFSDVLSDNLSNATAIGYKSAVNQDNSLVLGSINGVNTASSDTKVGIGTTTPSERLDVVGNLKLTGKFITPSGADAIVGTATLVAGTVTVNTNKVATNSIIILTKNTTSGGIGTQLTVPSASIVDGVSFTINSSSGTETSTVNWFIINQ